MQAPKKTTLIGPLKRVDSLGTGCRRRFSGVEAFAGIPGGRFQCFGPFRGTPLRPSRMVRTGKIGGVCPFKRVDSRKSTPCAVSWCVRRFRTGLGRPHPGNRLPNGDGRPSIRPSGVASSWGARHICSPSWGASWGARHICSNFVPPQSPFRSSSPRVPVRRGCPRPATCRHRCRAPGRAPSPPAP